MSGFVGEDNDDDSFDPTDEEFSRQGLLSIDYSLESAGERSQSTYASHRRCSINRMSVGSYISLSRRGPKARIIPDLLAYVRTVFLELVRVKYWQMVESGKLPRLSHSTRFLLYSVDVGLEGVKTGLTDWSVIEEQLEHVAWFIKLLSTLINYLPISRTEGVCLCSNHFSLIGLLAFFLARREKRAVYLLTSFIEAHEHAQKKLRSFLGGAETVYPQKKNEGSNEIRHRRKESDTSTAPTIVAGHGPHDGDDITTPEEVFVIKESNDAVSEHYVERDLYEMTI